VNDTADGTAARRLGGSAARRLGGCQFCRAMERAAALQTSRPGLRQKLDSARLLGAMVCWLASVDNEDALQASKTSITL
jgi:hypothetical protein